MSALGSLVVKLALEHAEFTKGLDKSSQEALRFAKNSQDSFNKFEQSAKASFNSAIKSTAGLVAGLLGVSSAIGALNQSINQLAVLDDLSQKTGSTVEELSRLQKVAQQFGQDFGAVEGSLTKLARGIGDLDDEGGKANKALNALGISSKDLSGNLRDPAELMVEVAKRLQNYQDGASKAAIATDLFGKAGVDLLPFLNDLAENVDKFATVSTEAAARAAAFQDNLGLLKVRASEAGISIASGVIPALNEIITKFIEGSEKGGLFQGVLDGILEAGKKLVVGSDENERAAKIANVNKRILSDEKKLRDLIKQGRAEEAATLKADIEAQKQGMRELIILQSKAYGKSPASPYTNPSDKPALIYNSGDGKAAMEKAQREAEKARQEALRAIQDEVTEELEAADTISAYKQDKLEELAKAKKELDKQEYERQLKQLDLLQAQANKNFDEAQKRTKELEQEAKRSAEEINRSLTDALLRGFESGKSFAQNFRDTLVNMFQTLVLRPIINFVLNQSGITSLLGGLGSVFSGNAIAGEGGGGIPGVFGSIKDIFTNTNNSIVSSIQDLGTFLSTGNGGLGDTIGGFLGQYSSQIADGFGYFGAALQLAQGNIGGALGAGIGTFFGGPIGGAIGSFLGGALGGLFGDKLPPRIYSAQNTSMNANGTFNQSIAPALKSSWDSGGANDALGKLNESVLGSVSALFKAFGQAGNLTAFSAVSKKKSADAGLVLYLDGEKIAHNYTGKIKKGSIQQAFEALVNSSYKAINEAVANSDLSEGVKKFFKEINTNEAAVDAVNTLVALNQQLEYLPSVFNAVRNAIDTTAYTTSIDALKAQFAATQNFVNLFYSDAEKFTFFSNQLSAQFSELNQVIPNSRDQYRALVESINVVDAATRDQFNGLIALAPAMNQYFEYLEQQANGINEVNEALANGLNKDLYSTYADFVSAQANVSSGLTDTFMAKVASPTAMNETLIAEVKALRQENADLRVVMEVIAKNTYDTAKVQKQWNGDGLPETRVI